MQPGVSGGLRPPQASFNPHPARRPDATGPLFGVSILIQRRMVQVSILIQPEGRMQLNGRGPVRRGGGVSILIQPEGRMQPPIGTYS